MHQGNFLKSNIKKVPNDARASSSMMHAVHKFLAKNFCDVPFAAPLLRLAKCFGAFFLGSWIAKLLVYVFVAPLLLLALRDWLLRFIVLGLIIHCCTTLQARFRRGSAYLGEPLLTQRSVRARCSAVLKNIHMRFLHLIPVCVCDILERSSVSFSRFFGVC